MRSIEDLTDDIRTRASKLQFQEAMRAYSAGAYRAATIVLWTSVMQDLTDKLRVIADAGDAAAITAIAQLDTARAAKDVRGMQTFENVLLKRAQDDFEFLTPREAEELGRLGEDRNTCAHPSFQDESDDFYQVTAEQVRANARLVVEAVLSQPPIVGKQLVDRFAADTKSDSWPDESLVDFLRGRYFDRARSGAMRNILIVAVKSAIRPPDGDNQVAGRCLAAIRAASEIDEQLTMEAIMDVLTKWQYHLTDSDLIRMLGAVGTFKVTWSSLGHGDIARLSKLLVSAPLETLIEDRAFASGPPVEDAIAKDYQLAIDRLSIDQLDRMTRKPYPLAQWVPRVLEQTQAVGGWREGEQAMRMVQRVISCMTLEDLETIANAFVHNDQIHKASDVPQLMQRIVEASASKPGALAIWQNAFSEYSKSYSPVGDPGHYYDYSEVRDSISALASQ
jgi:hypothetical protein